ncbi:hypothetical protein XF24_00456 [candidate division SR1 bacterium Aalborg_AAW-1]|nr:hypothetical protein XF24_00456 [candidate division SR1 bacterium Aalborg_AAW-1]
MKIKLIVVMVFIGIRIYSQEKSFKVGFQLVPNVTFVEGQSATSDVAIGVGGIYSFNNQITTINTYNFKYKSVTSVWSYSLSKNIQPYLLYRASFDSDITHYISLGLTTPLTNNDNTYLGYIEVGRNLNKNVFVTSIGILIPIMKKITIKGLI